VKWLTLCLIIVGLSSCASRKTVTMKLNSSQSKDSITELVVDVNLINNTNVFRDELLLELEIRPAIDSMPMFIAGVEYKNAILTSRKKQVKVIDTSKLIVSKKVLKTTKLKQSSNVEVKKKDIDKKVNYSFLIYVVILILIIYLLWQSRRHLLRR